MVPALVLGHGVTALGVVRSLGRAGIPLLVASATPEMERWSRWYRPAPGSWGGRLEDDLRGSSLAEAVLIPCSDHAAVEVACLPSDLSARFRSSGSSAELLEQLVDKARLSALLDMHGVDHARTWSIGTKDDLERVPDERLGTVFIKPRDTQRFFARYGRKSLTPSGRGSIWDALEKLRDEGLTAVLQEYVPGPATNGYLLDGFVDERGVVRGLLVRQRLRMHPPDFGNSSAVRTVPRTEAAPAERALRRFLEAVGYRGVFSTEFKRDERDGAFRLLDFNPRAWWHVEFAARCGLDVVSMAYRDALGTEVGSVDQYQVGRTVIYPYYDIFACLELRRRGDAGLFECARSWIGADQMIFAADDTRPFFRATMRLWSRYLGRRWRRHGRRVAEGSGFE